MELQIFERELFGDRFIGGSSVPLGVFNGRFVPLDGRISLNHHPLGYRTR